MLLCCTLHLSSWYFLLSQTVQHCVYSELAQPPYGQDDPVRLLSTFRFGSGGASRLRGMWVFSGQMARVSVMASHTYAMTFG